jgi:hypothetical protein
VIRYANIRFWRVLENLVSCLINGKYVGSKTENDDIVGHSVIGDWLVGRILLRSPITNGRTNQHEDTLNSLLLEYLEKVINDNGRFFIAGHLQSDHTEGRWSLVNVCVYLHN